MTVPSGAGGFQFANTSPYAAGLVDGYGDLFDLGSDRAKVGGIENVIEYNGFKINVPGRQDRILVTSIDGLADADVRDTREPNPGYDGETAFESYYGGRTIVISGIIKAGTLSKLRDMQEGLKSIFAPLDEAALILKGLTPDYDIQIFCRKSQPITMGETQKNFLFERDFQVTLRASDFRFTTKTIQEEYWDWWGADNEEDNSYSALVLADEPTLYWRMDEASGATTFINSVASGVNAGTKVGTTSAVGASGAVLDGSYWDLNGSTNYITSSYTPYASGTSRTFEAWVNRDTSDTEDVIFGSSDATNSPRLAFPSGTGAMVFKPNGATGSGVTFTASGIGSTGWKHIALVFEDSTNTTNLYLNGAQVASGTTADQFHATPGNFEVGRSATAPDGLFDGKIAEVAVYERALDETEIASHYNSRTKYFSGNKYADQVVNSGNYLADAIIKIEGPIYASGAGQIGIEISNTADESLNLGSLGISATSSDVLAQDITSISSGNQTTALAITYNNTLKIKAPFGTTTVIEENEYLLINTNTRTINKYSGGLVTSAYSQLDMDSEWIKLSPGVNPIYVKCYGYSRPLITFYYRHTFI
jgi:hypothetical protein